MLQTVADCEAAWQALANRSPAPKPGLIIAIKTTHIYCRYGCPARLPLQKNVCFYHTADDARAAGYRACKRCKPDEGSSAVNEPELLTRAYRLLEQEGAMPLSRLAARLGASAGIIEQIFKTSTGLTPAKLAEAKRFQQLRGALPSAPSVTDAIYAAGFGGPRRVYELGHTTLGMTPARYAKGGAGLVIGYTIVITALGALLVAATDKGICQIMIGAEAAELETILKARFHAAKLLPDADLAASVAAIVAYLHGDMPLPDLPLDIQATAFEARVWKALTKIPDGETLTYGAIAKQIGKPGAARAVGRACGANPVAILIPCHRALAASGALTGYRWGLNVKTKLLAIEIQRR